MMIECVILLTAGYVLGRTCHDHLMNGVVKPTVRYVKKLCRNIADN